MDSGPLMRTGSQFLPSADAPASPGRDQAWPAHPGFTSQDSLLRDYARVLVKRKWVVVVCLAVIFGAVAVATLRTTRIYEAVGSIAINKSDPMQLSFKDTPSASEDYYDSADLDTEVR